MSLHFKWESLITIIRKFSEKIIFSHVADGLPGLPLENDLFCRDFSKFHQLLKNSHSEKTLSNKTPAFTKGTNMDIWLVGKSIQLFIRGS